MLLYDEEIEDMIAEYTGNSTSASNGLVNARNRPRGGICFDIAPGFSKLYFKISNFYRKPDNVSCNVQRVSRQCSSNLRFYFNKVLYSSHLR